MEPWEILFDATLTFVAISVIYRKTIGWDVLEGMIIGGGVGIQMVVAWYSTQSYFINPIAAGTADVSTILGLLYGITYFFILYYPLRPIFSTTLGLGYAISIGVGVTYYFAVTFDMLKSFASFTGGWMDIVPLIGLVTGFMYLMFTKKITDHPLIKYPAKIGVYFIFSCLAILGAQMFYRYMGAAVPAIQDAAKGIGIIPGIIVLVLILLDRLGVIGKSRAVQEVPSS